jgi:hypothetical protein
MKQSELALLRKECVEGNSRACETLEYACANGRTEVCHYVP